MGFLFDVRENPETLLHWQLDNYDSKVKQDSDVCISFEIPKTLKLLKAEALCFDAKGKYLGNTAMTYLEERKGKYFWYIKYKNVDTRVAAVRFCVTVNCCVQKETIKIYHSYFGMMAETCYSGANSLHSCGVNRKKDGSWKHIDGQVLCSTEERHEKYF